MFLIKFAGNKKADKSNIGLIVGIVVAVVVLLAVGGAVFYIWRRSKFSTRGITKMNE